MQRNTLHPFGPIATRALLRGYFDWRLAAATRLDTAAAEISRRTRMPRAYARAAIATVRVSPIAARIVLDRRPLHVHVESESSDCDGRMDRGYTHPIHSGRAWWAWHRLAKPLEYARGEYGPGLITVEGGAIHSFIRTDEGYTSAIERVCADPECDPDAYTQRDHSAEAAGY